MVHLAVTFFNSFLKFIMLNVLKCTWLPVVGVLPIRWASWPWFFTLANTGLAGTSMVAGLRSFCVASTAFFPSPPLSSPPLPSLWNISFSQQFVSRGYSKPSGGTNLVTVGSLYFLLLLWGVGGLFFLHTDFLVCLIKHTVSIPQTISRPNRQAGTSGELQKPQYRTGMLCELEDEGTEVMISAGSSSRSATGAEATWCLMDHPRSTAIWKGSQSPAGSYSRWESWHTSQLVTGRAERQAEYLLTHGSDSMQ